MIGKPNHNIDVSYEYYRLAKEDERVGLVLLEQGEYRHSMYFLVQAMEKYVRAKTFSIVNPLIPYFRERSRNHSVEDAVDFLVEVVTGDKLKREQMKKQIKDYVLGGIRYNHLHNNLRYPYYSERYSSYSCIQVSKSDNEIIAQKLHDLKKFISDMDKI